MRLYGTLGFMFLVGVESTQVSSLELTVNHIVDLPLKSILIYDLPNTFIQRHDARALNLATSTNLETTTAFISTGHEQPLPIAYSVISALTETITVPITTSTLANHLSLPLQVTPLAPSACFESLCKQSVAFGYPNPVSTVVAFWSIDHPDTQTLVNQSLTTIGDLTLTLTTPLATIMASSIGVSSTSYSVLDSTTISLGSAPTDEVHGTHGPPPVITSTDSFSTPRNSSTTADVSGTWSNDITSIMPTVTSFHVTTVDPSTESTTDTASSTATFGSETSTAMATVTTSSGFVQSSDSKGGYYGLLKKRVLWMVVAAVVNISFAAM